MAHALPFFEDDRPARPEGAALVVDVGGFEGPLDLLLELARRQKVDLHRISILALAEQYIAFVEEARALRLELAADYLVMAAWLAYLKSRLLLPTPARGEEPSAAEMATALAMRLRRLEAVRGVAKKLYERDQLGREVFARGAPEPVVGYTRPRHEATLYDLLKAYAQQRQKNALSHVTIAKRIVWSLVEAREALERMVGRLPDDWTDLDDLILTYIATPDMRATVKASSFSAILEMVKEGALDLRQDRAFAQLHIRPRRGGTGRAV